MKNSNAYSSKEKLIKIILNELNEKVTYVVIRSKEEFFNNIHSEIFDIDLYVDSYTSYKNLKLILEEFGFLKRKKFNSFHSPFHSFWFDIHLSKIQRYPLICTEKLIKRRILDDECNIYFASPVDQIKINMIQPMDIAGLRGWRPHSEKKLDYIDEYKKFLNNAIIEIKSELGQRMANTIYRKYIEKDMSFTYFEKLKLKLSVFASRPSIIFSLLYRVIAKFMSLLPKRSKLIVVCGVDGAGKSTLINSLERELVRNGLSVSIKYYGLLGGYSALTETMLKLYGKIKRKNNYRQVRKDKPNLASNVNSDNLTPKKVAIDLLVSVEVINRLVILLANLYLLKNSVIADRYVYDAFVSGKGGGGLVRLVSRLYPKPDIIIFLQGNPEMIFLRKREYSPKEIAVHQEQLENVLYDTDSAVKKINAMESPNEILKIAYEYTYKLFI